MALTMALAMMLSLCSVNAFAAGAVDFDIKDYEIEYTGYYTDIVYLEDLLAEELYYSEYEADIDDWEFWTDEVGQDPRDFELKYGTISYSNYRDEYVYEIDLTDEDYDDLMYYGYLEENRIYYWAEEYNYEEYEGYIDLVIVSEGDYDLEYEMNGETDLALGELLIDDLYELLPFDLYSMEFDPDSTNDCGELLYWDDYYDTWDDFNDRAEYYCDPDYDDYALDGVYFEPDGTEGEFYIDFTAYGERYDEEINGTIIIYCGEGLMLEADIAGDDVYTFDSYDFQEAVEDWNSAYSLVYIDNVKLADSTDGYLYYDYDEDDRSHDSISGTEEYYVDDNARDVLDYITFVPARGIKGEVLVRFDAFVKRSNRDVEKDPLAGVLKINVDQEASITVKAGVGDIVEIDWEVFQDYLDEDTNSTKYDVEYVTISGAPRSATEGYLICDDEELTGSRDKVFYMDPTNNQYDLRDLCYEAGSKVGSYEATFTVYYDKSTTNRANIVPTSEGTIKFEVSATSSITTTTPLKASQVMNFAYELEAVRNLGGNDNEYIEFTSLPVNGKLYYNFGTADQQDVTVGKDYYLTSEYGQLQLSKVTYVPSYSSSKVMKYDTISVKGYDEKDNAIKGSINIAIQYASYSAQFTDVKDSTYADSVDYLYNQKITTGMTATTFGLTDKVTRGQFVTFLYRAAGSPVVTGVTNKFTDVKVADYYYNAVLWAVKNGITSGMTDTTFEPNMNVTHEQLLTFLYRYDVAYLGHSSALGSSSSVYDYNSVESWAQIPVKWAVGKNVISYGNLLPKDAGTRATVALWLHRMLTL